MAATLTIKEGISTLELQERLGLLETHAGPKAAVELEHHSLAQEADVLFRQRLVRRQAVHRLNRALWHHQVGTARELGVIVLERGDGGVVQTLRLALRLESRPLWVLPRALAARDDELEDRLELLHRR